MRGHAPIIRMRLAGTRPRIVFINDFPSVMAGDWHNPGEKYGEVWPADHATVEIQPGDNISTLDLRWLLGTTVSITGSTEQRTKALFAACIKAGAKTVAASHAIFEGPRILSGWTEVRHG